MSVNIIGSRTMESGLLRLIVPAVLGSRSGYLLLTEISQESRCSCTGQRTTMGAQRLSAHGATPRKRLAVSMLSGEIIPSPAYRLAQPEQK
jgi:hypothetical protein